MNFWVIDRIEDNLVICQDENFNTIKINKELIVGILKEGYIIRKEKEKYILDEKKTIATYISIYLSFFLSLNIFLIFYSFSYNYLTR